MSNPDNATPTQSADQMVRSRLLELLWAFHELQETTALVAARDDEAVPVRNDRSRSTKTVLKPVSKIRLKIPRRFGWRPPLHCGAAPVWNDRSRSTKMALKPVSKIRLKIPRRSGWRPVKSFQFRAWRRSETIRGNRFPGLHPPHKVDCLEFPTGQQMFMKRETDGLQLRDRFWGEILRFWSCWDEIQDARHSVPLEIERTLIEHRHEVLTTKWFCDLDEALNPAAEWVEENIGLRNWVTHFSEASAEHRAASIQRHIQRLASSPPEPCDITAMIGERLKKLHSFAKSGFLGKFATETVHGTPEFEAAQAELNSSSGLPDEVVAFTTQKLAGLLGCTATTIGRWAKTAKAAIGIDTPDQYKGGFQYSGENLQKFILWVISDDSSVNKNSKAAADLLLDTHFTKQKSDISPTDPH
jgi:hypothetical protein